MELIALLADLGPIPFFIAGAFGIVALMARFADTDRSTRYGQIRRGKAAEEKYKATLAASAGYSARDLRILHEDEMNELGLALEWAVVVHGAFSVPEIKRLHTLLFEEESRRSEAALEARRRAALGLPAPGNGQLGAFGRLRDRFHLRTAAAGDDFFSSSTLEASEKNALRQMARSALAEPKSDLTKLEDHEVLETGIALELEKRHRARKGERSLSMDTEYRRYEQEWRRRHLDDVPKDSLLAARGVGDIGQVVAHREQVREAAARAAWDSDFSSLVKKR
jgi:hypothetical protein